LALRQVRQLRLVRPLRRFGRRPRLGARCPGAPGL